MTQQPNQTLLLDQDMVKQLLTVSDINQAVDETFKGYGNDQIKNPTKVTLDIGQHDEWPAYDGFVNAMPAYLGTEDVAGLKWVAGIAGERKAAGLPYITGLIILLDPHLGHYLAVMDGTYITDMRTGSQTANTIHYLACDRSHISLGLYGAGRQAETTLITLSDYFKIDDLYLWNRNLENAKKLMQKIEDRVTGTIHLVDPDHPKDASHEEFTVTATAATSPILKAEWFQPGQTIITMGSGPEAEDDLLLKADAIFTDHVEQALHRGALSQLHEQGQFTADDLTATIGELALTPAQYVQSDQLTIIPIVGTGAMDISVAKRAYDKALTQQVGQPFDFKA
ncbi:MAG: ornithine cyclodeaminase family protein [Aerococcus sp.]|nr:ornithine cyclodeaminase family protein [Aerococcus sp.]